MKLSLSLLIVPLSSFMFDDTTVHAFPSAAGSCATGIAVGGLHLTNPTTGTLAEGDFQFVLDQNTILIPNSNVITIAPFQTYSLTVAPVPGSTAYLRGVLIRVDGPGTYTMDAGVNAQVADTCVAMGVAGVTHTGASKKVELGASFSTESVGAYEMEVSVVVTNSETFGSIYYYDKFVLMSIDGSLSSPTMSPNVTSGKETFAPVGSATRVPSAAPMVASVRSGTPSGFPIAISTPTNSPSNSLAPSALADGGVTESMLPVSSDIPSSTSESDVPSFLSDTSVPSFVPSTSESDAPFFVPVPIVVNPMANASAAAAATTSAAVSKITSIFWSVVAGTYTCMVFWM
jgi:hypothetical protein